MTSTREITRTRTYFVQDTHTFSLTANGPICNTETNALIACDSAIRSKIDSVDCAVIKINLIVGLNNLIYTS